MLATLVDNLPKDAKKWVHEIKWDGYRAVAYCNQNEINLISRNNKFFNKKYYPLIAAFKKLNFSAIFDGEIVVINKEGIPSFESLQNWRSEADGELHYYVFDLLWLNGRSLLNTPLMERKKLLKSLALKEGIITESECFYNSGEKLLKEVVKIGLEGIIVKEADSLYFPGLRSKEWLKIKAKKRQEVIIGGYTQNENSPKLFSSLLVGVLDNGQFHYIGKIGTGFNEKMQHEMMKKFRSHVIKKCPFEVMPEINIPSRFRPNPPIAEVTWLSPKIVCEVTYTEITKDGILRHASFEGLREDKNAEDVHKEVIHSTQKIVKKLPYKKVAIEKEQSKTLLNPFEETQTKTISGHDIKFNNLSKIFWPEDRFTKRDLLNYYYQVASYILPYLKNRPQSLNRFPNGISGQSFYQKDVTRTAPDWMIKFPYHTSDDKDKNYLVVQNESDILWMANLGAIEMNPWNSTIQKPNHPTWCIIDIDPSEANTFTQVIKTAQVTKQILDELNIEGYCKTSGSTGLHIYIPMGSKYSYEECQLFGRILATEVHKRLPTFTSIERYNVNRKDKVYIDFLQNRPKATLAAPYSVRPKPGATISMPLYWDEVIKGLKLSQFTLKNAVQRIKVEGDLFRPVLGKGINLKKALHLLNFQK